MSLQTRCSTCNIGFDNVEAMRTHYSSEHHLANVRLRVDGKAPMSRAQFEMSRVSHHDNEEAEAGDAPTFYCKLCKKTFRSVQTLQSHVKSTAHLIKKEQRIIARDSDAASMLTSTSLGSAALGLHRRHKAHHKENLRIREQNAQKPKVSMDEREEDCGCRRCIFCGLARDNTDDMLAHMLEHHDFAVPLVHRCTNIDGLLDYLGRKVNGLMCIVCNEKTRAYESLEAVRAHMESTQHHTLTLSPEYQDFYEGPLMDLDKKEEHKYAGMGQIVVADGRKTILARDHTVPQPRALELDSRREQRKMITAQQVEQRALVKQQAYEANAPMLKLANKDLKESRKAMHKYSMQQGVKNNKLHPKGYDGEGEVN